jgi:hypothetical protein
VPQHEAQFALLGIDDEQIKEASWAAQVVTGLSAYMYGIGYDKELNQREIDATVEYIKSTHE